VNIYYCFIYFIWKQRTKAFASCKSDISREIRPCKLEKRTKNRRKSRFASLFTFFKL